MAKGPGEQKSDPNAAASGGARPKSSSQIEGHGIERLGKEQLPKDAATGSVQLLKKNIPGNAQGARTSKVVGEHSDMTGASDSDGRRRWDQEDRAAGGAGSLNAARLRADADDGFLGQQGSHQLADASDPSIESAAIRREVPAYRVINQTVGPRPEQVLRSAELSGDQMRSLGHAQQAAASNAQFVGQLAHSQHGVDVHQLPPDAQFLHQHMSQEPCLQQPIFLVKLPQQQQMAPGGSQQPQVILLQFAAIKILVWHGETIVVKFDLCKTAYAHCTVPRSSIFSWCNMRSHSFSTFRSAEQNTSNFVFIVKYNLKKSICLAGTPRTWNDPAIRTPTAGFAGYIEQCSQRRCASAAAAPWS